MEDALQKIRQQIDTIDDQLIKLLNERMELVRQVGEIKRAGNAIIYRPEREKSIIDRLEKKSNGLLSRAAIEAIFLEIFAVSRNFELPERIAYLGPEGSFTHQAAESRFGGTSSYMALGSIKSVFDSVATGQVRFGVVPIENNQEGTVTETVDLLAETGVKIVAEIPMDIHFAFASKQDKPELIHKIYSKDIAFRQCKRFLSEYFGENTELVPVESTSKAAKIAAEEENSAAICTHVAAKIYKLPLLFENIEDSPNNRTRFLIISKDFNNQRSENNKTTIIARLADRAGSLANLLQDFNVAQINLCKIDSRPARQGDKFKYWFLIEFEGHYEDMNVKWVLEKHSEFVQLLGSYVRLT
jgi:chorismate mutase/prephenate dehydratase